jgi:hypothetical protein
MKNFLPVLMFVLGTASYAQVGVGTPAPDTSTMLDIVSNNKGIMIPRVSLSGTTDATTMVNGNRPSLLVFNTQTIGDIKPGYYYWYNSKWNKIVNADDVSTALVVSTLVNDGTGKYTYTNEIGGTTIIDIPAEIKTTTTNTASVAGNTLTSTVNGVAATADVVSGVSNALVGNNLSTTVNGMTGAVLDLTPLLATSTVVSNASTGNTGTVTVNGKTSTGAPIINTNKLGVTAGFLTSTVNGVDSNALDLKTATTHTLGSVVNTLTSDVNGVSVTTPIVNSNKLAVDGGFLTSTVNGVDSNALDLKTATTHTLGSSVNTLASDVNGVSVTTPIVNSNKLAVDGGFLTSTVNGVDSNALDLKTATTHTLGSSVNTLASDVNGVSVTAPIVNSNVLSVTGNSLTSTINGIASNALDLKTATTNSLSVSAGVLTSTVNSVASSANVLATATNGLTVSSGSVKLGGALTEATTVNTTATETLALNGLVETTTFSTDKIVVADATTGMLKVAPASKVLPAISTKTSSYSALETDETILVNAAGGAVTITLPSAVVASGKKFNVKKIDDTDNIVTITSTAGTIDTVASVSGAVWLQSWVLQSDGTNWFVISRN